MSSAYKIHISEERAFALRERAKELDTTINKVITALVEDEAPLTLAAAAEVFMNQLDPEHKRLILDCCNETKRSPATYILAYIQRAHDQGATAIPVPEIAEPREVARPTAPQPPSTCAYCHKPFFASQEGQKYCPMPDDGESCGRKASLQAVRDARSKKVSPAIIPAPHVVERVVKL